MVILMGQWKLIVLSCSCPAHPEGSHCTCRYRGSTIRSRIFCVPGVEINVLSLEATFESRTTTTALRTPLPGWLDVLDGRPTCLCWLIKSYRLLFWRCYPNTQHRYPRYRIGGDIVVSCRQGHNEEQLCTASAAADVGPGEN